MFASELVVVAGENTIMHAAGPVRHQEEVVLNVYDLSRGWNAWGGPMGLGLYHSGLQVSRSPPRPELVTARCLRRLATNLC